MNIQIPGDDKKTIPQQKRKHGVKKISKQDKNFETILTIKSKQFKFDCGAIMGKIKVNFDNKFCLIWHYNNTTNLEEFISSVSDFLNITDNKITTGDITKLEREYNSIKQ